MNDKYTSAHEVQKQLDEVSSLRKKIQVMLRAKQFDGIDISTELQVLMGRLLQQEADIWWDIRRIQIAREEAWKPLLADTHNRMNGFRESCARAMSLLPLG